MHLIVAIHVGLAHAGVVAGDDLAEEGGAEQPNGGFPRGRPPPILPCTQTHTLQ